MNASQAPRPPLNPPNSASLGNFHLSRSIHDMYSLISTEALRNQNDTIMVSLEVAFAGEKAT